MNTWDDFENTLRGFRPRRPSPKVRAALFEHRPPPATRGDRGLAAGHDALPLPVGGLPQFWLAPLTAAALVVLTLASPWSANVSLDGERPSHSLASLSAAWTPGPEAVGTEQNSPMPSFRSTNTGAIAPSFGFLLLRQTNVFAR